MRSRSVFIVTAGVVVAALFVSAFEDAPSTTAAPPEETQPYLVPQEDPGPAFEPNLGQAPEDVIYVSHAPAPDVALTRRGARFRIPAGDSRRRSLALDLELTGARLDARVRGQDPRPGRSHYYRGADPAAWITDVPHYGTVVYRDVYPGVDASFQGHDEGIEYNFRVRPGADPRPIRVRFRNARAVRVDDSGDLLIDTPEGSARQRAPFAFQERDGRRERVDARYRVVGRQELALELGIFDRGRELVIDPVLVFGTYLETFDGRPADVAVDAPGNTYVAGSTKDGFGFLDVVVLKLAPNGQVQYRTTIGSFFHDMAGGIAVEPAGSVWVTGWSSQPMRNREFPRTVGAYQTEPGGSEDAFFLKLSPSGQLQYSSFLGGSGEDRATDVALGPGGELYIGGATTSQDFPLRSAAQPAFAGWRDAFVTKLDPTGRSLAYSTYLGGSGDEGLHALQVDSAGRAWIGGATYSTDFPLADAVQTSHGGGQGDGFFARLGPSGSVLEQSSYIGGSGLDHIMGLTLDGSSLFVTGWTDSADFPLRDPIQATRSPWSREGFLSKVAGNSLAFSTYVGLNGGGDIALGPGGSMYMTGTIYGGVTASRLDSARRGYEWTFGEVGSDAIAVHANGDLVTLGHVSSGHRSFPTYNATASFHFECAECDSAMVLARIGNAAAPPPQHNEDDDAVQYEGSWTMLASPEASGGVLAFSSEPGAKVMIDFVGTGIQVFGRRAPSGSRIESTISGSGAWRWNADLHADPPQPRALIYSITGLTTGAHRLTVTNAPFPSNDRGPDCWFDGFTVLTGGAVPTATPGPTSPPPATVTPQPPLKWTRVEDSDARIAFAGSWYAQSVSAHSGGTARLAMDAGASATLSFRGSGVAWIGARDPWSGIATIYVDGALWATVDTYSATEQTRAVLFRTTLEEGNHTVRVEATGTRHASSNGSWIWVDALELREPAGPTPTITPTLPPPGTPTPTPTPTLPPRATPTPTGAPTPGRERIEDGDARIAYAGTWFTNASPNANHSGGTARLAGDAGDTAILTFNGTGVKWQGLRDPWAGIARVFVDGTLRATVDTYTAVEQLRQTLFTLDGLAGGAHTIRVEVTGTRNPGSGGNFVWLDAFDVTSGSAPPTATPTPTPTAGPTPSAQRIEDGDSRITYAGVWYTNASPSANHSGGTSRLSGEPGVTATLTFNGTGVKWNGLKDPWAGIARVFVDGTLRATVDTYSAVEQLRQVLFSIGGLPSGSHTIRIEVTGTRHPDSGGALVWVDAFDVAP